MTSNLLAQNNIELKKQSIFFMYIWRQKSWSKLYVVASLVVLMVSNFQASLEYYFYSTQGIDWLQNKNFLNWVQWRYFIPFFMISFFVPIILLLKTYIVFKLRFILLILTILQFILMWYSGIAFTALFLHACLLALPKEFK